jgi:hypothetical protein
MSEKKNPDPTPSSPAKVCKNRAYKEMKHYQRNSYWPLADEVVVKHISSNTFWRAVYAVYDDSSNYDWAATWKQVFPKQITITKYEIK